MNTSVKGILLYNYRDLASIAIMHAFVDLMVFKEKSFVHALRSFLQHFRLPGESQKIDRFMLKFASNYVKENPSSFNSADTAYVLAYSVIMLNTDLFNPQVKKRMSCADFVKNNRGIDEGKDVHLEFLEAIYEEISSNEIQMKGEIELKKKIKASVPTKKKKFAAEESIPLDKAIKKYGASKDPASLDSTFSKMDFRQPFFSATQTEHVKPMFQLIWMSCLMSVSSFLQKSEDIETLITALEG